MMAARPKLRLLRGTGAVQWVATTLETTRYDGLVLRVEKCPARSVFAGQWEGTLDVPMPTEERPHAFARRYVRGLLTSAHGAMEATEQVAAGIGDVRPVLAFLNAAPLLARLWWCR